MDGEVRKASDGHGLGTVWTPHSRLAALNYSHLSPTAPAHHMASLFFAVSHSIYGSFLSAVNTWAHEKTFL